MICHIDWISATLPLANFSFEWIRETFGERVEMPRGFRGYTRSAHLPNRGIIAWTPERVENRLLLVLSARALSAWTRSGHDLICDIIQAEGQFTRLDLAMDDKGEAGAPLVTPERVRDWCRSGRVVTFFQGWEWNLSGEVDPDGSFHYREIESASFAGGQPPGRTVYIGSRSSDSFVRVYDKRAQVLALDPEADAGELPAHWCRFELETKGKRAEKLGPALAAGLDPVGYCASVVDFKRRSRSDTNRRRWKRAKWWNDFLAGAEPDRLTIPSERVGLEDLLSWLENQVSAALWVAHETGYMGDLLEAGRKKAARNPRMQSMLKGEL